MNVDEPTPPAGRALSPEEVGARVSAILEAAERDARAVIDAAHRELAAKERGPLSLERLARELDELAARVATLERVTVTVTATTAGAAAAEPEPPAAAAEVREWRPAVEPAARVRAIELALAGYSREAIARELAASMAPGDVEGLLDEVLTR